jgi:hypothetical protein
MLSTPLLDYAGLTPEAVAAVAALVAPQTTLAAVMRWAGAGAIEEIITQDEFTHDVLIALPAAASPAVLPRERRFYLVYDST